MCILVIGSLNMDTSYKLTHLPAKGETILAKSIYLSRGGKGQNQAVAAARLGSKVILAGAVGNDNNGIKIKEDLIKDNIDISQILEKNNTTGCASIYIDEKGNNNIVVYPGANYDIEEIDVENIFNNLNNIKYCILQMEIPLKIIYKTLELCKEKNIITILNPAPFNLNFNIEYLKYVDYLIPNETELSLMVGYNLNSKNIEKACKDLIKKGCKNILLTLGEKGSILFNEKEVVSIRAKKVKAIDTTAAGDSYIGAFVTYLSEGNSVKDSMAFATKVSAKAVTKEGAIDSLPYRKDIDE